MTKIFHQIKQYLKYRWQAKSAHGIHSPFVYDLVTNILQSESRFYCFDEIEIVREELKHSEKKIKRSDLGAGTSDGQEVKVASFARKSLCPPKYCRLIFRLIQHLKYKNILEMGTALGITTAYMASTDSEKVSTMEGDPELVSIASEVWNKLEISEIELYQGDFSDSLRLFTEAGEQTDSIDSRRIDMAFVDGNHRKEPTLQYVEILKRIMNKNGLIVIDDIYWSKEMTEAWELLKKDPFFSISVDLYRMGLLFNREQVEKQNFILKY